jgi:hypothetical protein
MPGREGGLGSPVIWLDGGNTFNPYTVSEISKDLGLYPERVLKGIYISRAFTCYQMSSLVLEKLWNAVDRFKSKFVVISDLPHLYIESDIPRREAEKAFAPVLEELRTYPERKGVLILVTSLARPFSKGRITDALASSADVVLRMRERMTGFEARLEKHPTMKPMTVTFGARTFGVASLDEFAGGEEVG